jgi:hypothetical protein
MMAEQGDQVVPEFTGRVERFGQLGVFDELVRRRLGSTPCPEPIPNARSRASGDAAASRPHWQGHSWRWGRWDVTTELRRHDRTMDDDARGQSRRAFLRAAGLGSALLAFPALFAACSADATAPALLAPGETDKHDAHDEHHGTVVLDFHSDMGVLNYAYALEQLEAAFYTTTMYHPFSGMTHQEQRLLTDVRDHEIAHRDFLKAALGDQAIPKLTPMFQSIDFQSRDVVLNVARTFEDLGVAAYNGAAKYLESDVYLTIAGKIVSVEARHASAIRDLLMPRTGYFAPKAFDDAFAPTAVIAAASAYIAEKINVVNS